MAKAAAKSVSALEQVAATIETPAAVSQNDTPIAAPVAAAPVSAAPVTLPRQPQKLRDAAFGVASYKYNRWAATLDATQTLEDALDGNFWAHQSDKLMGHDKSKGVGDIIELRKPDTGLYCELIVTEIGKGFVKVEVVRAHEPEAVDVPESWPLTTRWNAGKQAHEVLRKADNIVMAQGFQTKRKAVAWIVNHMKAMAAA